MSSTHIRELPYNADSESIMLALSSFEMPAYLDSANHRGSNARRDILTAAPVAYLSIEDGVLSCSENAKEIVQGSIDSQIFINDIRVLKEHFLPETNDSRSILIEADYYGAIIAHLGYPVLHSKSQLRITDAFVGVYLWTIVVDHELRSCSLRFHPSCAVGYIEMISSRVTAAVAVRKLIDFQLTSRFEQQSSYEAYENAFNAIKAHIDRGDCYQVNLTQCFKASSQGDPLAAYLTLRKATTAPFSTYINWGNGALLSLSPERFISLSGKTVLTQPVKGTRPRSIDEREDVRLARELAASEKDTAENLMIVDLLRNDLGRVCKTGSIQANQLFTIESYSNVHHMVSDVSGTLKDGKDAADLLSSCYPGGSITGAPKLSAMSIIQQVERDPRRVYCGTVFCWSAQGNFDSNITIRSLLWQPGQISCWAGGGIVADSDCAQEYQECFDKIGNIFSALHH
mgnify:CR=1 FL=1